MANNRFINLYNDNGTLKQNIAGVTSTVGGSSYDQDLNTTDSPTFVTATATTSVVTPKISIASGSSSRDQMVFTANSQIAGADGGFNYDGKIFKLSGNGHTAALPPILYNYIQSSATSYANNAALTVSVFPSDRDGVLLTTGSMYEFEMLLLLTKVTTDEVSLSFTTTSVQFGDIGYSVIATDFFLLGGGNTAKMFGHNDITVCPFSTDGFSNYTVAKVAGHINAGTVGILTPKLTFSASGSGRSLLPGSYMKLTYLGDNTVGGDKIGTWA